jgi:hypothetical protein
MLKMTLETGNALHRGPVGELGGGSFTRTFQKQLKEAPGNGAFLINLIWVFWTQIMLGA